MKNKILTLFIVFFSLTACSQENKPTNTPNNMEITANNIVEKIASQVKHYPQEPYYYIYIENSLCIYEILVNDVPVVKNFEYGEYATPFYINNAILKSGTQKITYRLYPAPPEYNGENGDKFSKNTSFAIEVFVNDKAKKLPLGEEKLIIRENVARKTMMLGKDKDIKEEWFVAEGKDYYEASFNFDAQVPYEIEGWSKGQDLRKFDQKLLEQKVVEFYKQKSKIYSPLNLDKIAASLYPSFRDQMISEYRDKDYIQEGWDEFKEPYNSTYKILPLLPYKMVFYGDGKMVALVTTSIDVRYRSKSTLYGEYIDKDGDESFNFIRTFLYLPEGKKLEDGLEVIR